MPAPSNKTYIRDRLVGYHFMHGMGLCKLLITWWRPWVSAPSFEHTFLTIIYIYIYLLYRNRVSNKNITYIFDSLNDLHQSVLLCFNATKITLKSDWHPPFER